MASTEKQLSPEEVHFLLMHGNLSSPAVFKGMVQDWPASNWSPESLAQVLENRTLRFRTGPRNPASKDVLWETDCEYIDASLHQFCLWLDPVSPHPPEDSTDSNPLQSYNPANTWAYLDYKYMAELFSDQPDILEAVRWEDFGFPGRSGVESTIWVGSAGAHTPCHYDTYGCNLVLQVYGRKKWVLFPPEDSPSLYPTRLPYEESSVFSQVNVAHPNVEQHPKVVNSHPYVAVLEPGDVLFVPKHWWHYVESLSTSIAVNSWIEMTSDAEDRLQEAVVRLVLLSIKSGSDQSQWINPTENVTSRASNLGFVQAALEEVRAKNGPGCVGASTCSLAGGCPFPQVHTSTMKVTRATRFWKWSNEDTKTTPPPHKKSKLKDSERDKESESSVSFSTSSCCFGPNLVPVLPCIDYFNDKLCREQTYDVGTSQERTSVTIRPVDFTAAVKHTAAEHTAEKTSGENTISEITAVKQTSAIENSSHHTAPKSTSEEHFSVKSTSVVQNPDEHMSCTLDGTSTASGKVTSKQESPESTETSKDMDQGLEKLENTIVNCLVQPHVVQEVANLLKERLRLS